MGRNKLAYSGMDDAGEMSSWFVLSSIGLYTYSPADPEYIVTVPLFDKVTFDLGTKAFTIVREGESREIKTIECNGSPLRGLFVDHSFLASGGELKIVTK
jgi:putative alpha-1,2-mannosidase